VTLSGNPGGKKRVIPTPQAPQPAPQVGANPQPQPEVEQPSNAGRKRDGTFAKGFVANPAGKPKGTRHHATRLAEALIDGRAKELVDKAVDMALAGDPTALRIVMDRLCPPRRERTIGLEMPSIKSAADLITAAAALSEATAAGEITPGEAASLSTLVERDRIRERISQVKADQKARGRFLGGSVQFGYRLGDDGELAPHEAEQEAIREMIALKAQGRSLRAIAHGQSTFRPSPSRRAAQA
jgi:hypothetical protein